MKIDGKQTRFFLDSALGRKKGEKEKAANLKRKLKIIKENRLKPDSTLFSKGKRMKVFFTEDSKLYITPREYDLIKNGKRLNRKIKQWDSLSARIVDEYVRCCPSRRGILYSQFLKRYAKISENLAEQSDNLFKHFTPPKLWNASIIGAILLGMFSMSMIYRYLGQEVSAEDVHNNIASGEKVISADLSRPQVLGEEKTKQNTKEIVENLEKLEKKELEKKIKKMVKGYPIEKMVPYIMTKDKTVIAFLIGIAKKESNWGKRVPVLNGQDCYNYWGYRGKRRLMGSGGHTCFNSRKDAVDAVAKRLDWLVNNRKLNTPSKMVVWKCGSSCAATGGQAAARKWISDVNFYFKKLNK
ncbi:hypothetical protein J7J13_02465 [bacterium]|nr:hypothetical protein [bacterium]